jgi:hypothetical protein
MTENWQAQLATHDIEIREIHSSLDLLGKSVGRLSSRQDDAMKILTEIRAQNNANKPTAFMDIVKAASGIGMFLGMLVVSISFIVSAQSDSRFIALEKDKAHLEYRLSQMESQRVTLMAKRDRLTQ